jgi:hypothetical protein
LGGGGERRAHPIQQKHSPFLFLSPSFALLPLLCAFLYENVMRPREGKERRERGGDDGNGKKGKKAQPPPLPHFMAFCRLAGRRRRGR